MVHIKLQNMARQWYYTLQKLGAVAKLLSRFVLAKFYKCHLLDVTIEVN
jgi:hypothetical protein